MPKFLSDADVAALDQASPQASKPKFISDEQMSKLQVQSGDSPINTGIQSAANMVALKYGPDINALIEPAVNKIGNLLTGNNVQTDQSFGQRREDYAKRLALSRETNPKAALTGDVAGLVGGSLLLPGAGAVKAATGAGRIAKGAAIAAGYGAAQSPDQVEGQYNPIQLGERLKNAGIGLVAGGAGQAIGEGVTKAASILKDSAARQAFKSLGPYARETRQNYEKGRIESIGKTLLDEGVIGGVPKSYEKIAQKSEDLAQSKGKQIGSLISDVSQKSKTGIMSSDLADGLRQRLLVSSDAANKIAPIAQQNKYFETLINGFAKKDGSFTIEGAQDLKNLVNKQIKWDRLPGADIPKEEQFYRALYSSLNDQIETAAGKAAGAVGRGEELKGLKQAYGSAKEAASISSKREAKNFANRFLSPSDYGVAGVGAVIGSGRGDTPEDKIKNALLGASLGLGNKALRQYGPQVLATGLNNLGSVAGNASQITTPFASQQVLSPLVRKSLQLQSEKKGK